MKPFKLAAALCLAATAANADFAISFDWSGLASCTNGRPNTVGSPAFVLRDVPAGTTEIRFRLVDLNVPQFNHGGGTVRVGQSGQLPPGLFRYKSPCPPNGAHTYEWRAEARAGRQVIARASAQRRYPE
ncbi:MAG: hypothetical protein WBA67_03035 [Jannaschia sp.]